MRSPVFFVACVLAVVLVCGCSPSGCGCSGAPGASTSTLDTAPPKDPSRARRVVRPRAGFMDDRPQAKGLAPRDRDPSSTTPASTAD